MVTVLKFAMPTLLRLKSRVLAAEEGKIESEKVQRGYEGMIEAASEEVGRGAPWNGGLQRFYHVPSPFFLPLSLPTDEKGQPALIQDANFLLTDVNMRGHAEDRVYISRSLCSREVQTHFLPIGCTRSD